MHAYTRPSIRTYIHTYIYTYVHTHTHTHTQAHTHTHTHMCVCVCVCVCVCAYIHIQYVCIRHTYIHTHIHTYVYVCIHHMYKNKRWEARAYQQSIVIRAILLVNNVLACPQYRAGSKPRGHSSPDNKDGAPTSPLPTPDEVAARICFVCVCVRACVCMRESVCVCVYICLYVCMYVYSLYACMHACMYVYTHAHAHTHYMYTKNKGGGAHPGDPARQRHIAPHAPHSHVPHPAGGGRPAGTYSL